MAEELRKDEAKGYIDDAGEFRWVRIAPNGEIVGASTEGYKLESHMRENYERGNTGQDAPELLMDEGYGEEAEPEDP